MSLTLLEIEHIARLARLEITPAEVETACWQLNGIFSLIEALQAVDTAGIEPKTHVHDAWQRLRADEVTYRDEDGAVRDLLQSIAPDAENGLYLVPKVIE
ncbi:MAG: Asp-tRNA(Asn)/Glu-tRNA(Gln) amidotransferase subunit GatC [Betaproteobacteria bacterium]|nr:Asp-tRNA(Asn)/Glu-tRNA(Gln) amidotransferase subunit GatC [Betaproteobacteria bacterium]